MVRDTNCLAGRTHSSYAEVHKTEEHHSREKRPSPSHSDSIHPYSGHD